MSKEIKTVMHDLKIRPVIVSETQRLAPRIQRITFFSEAFSEFVSLSPDDHVKIFFPAPGESEPIAPGGTRETFMRDYTPHNFDKKTQTLQIDFFLHGEGVGSNWASNAKVGDKLIIAGPKGSQIVPYEFDGYILIGDESAIPSIRRRIEELPVNAQKRVIIQIENETERPPLPEDTFWIYRHGHPPQDPELILQALRNLPPLHGEVFTWISCEKSCTMKIKLALQSEFSFNRDWIKAKGYWDFEEN